MGTPRSKLPRSAPAEIQPGERLDSWKEIAGYFNRTVRTVQRWEQTRGLPVYRMPGGKLGAVCAIKSELDAWWHNRRGELEAEESTRQTAKRRRDLLWAGALLAGGVVIGSVIWYLRLTPELPDTYLTAVPLTTYPGSEDSPSFSPDGNRIAFAWDGEQQDNYDIYVRQIGTEGLLRLTTDPARDFGPAWSPDDRYIAFLRSLPGDSAAVVLVPPLGGPERRITEVHHLGLMSFWGPFLAWTQDSKSIVIPDRGSQAELWSLFLVSIETGAKRRLTTPPEESPGDFAPAISPDGQRLAFLRRTLGSVINLYVMDLSEDLRPATEPVPLTQQNRAMATPAWTRDGGEIIFFRYLPGDSSLWRVSSSGFGEPRRLPLVDEHGWSPTISSGSQPPRLVYERGFSDIDIWRAEIPHAADVFRGKTRSPVRLVSSTFWDNNPQYSPDGTGIAFRSERSGNAEIWVCDADGSHERQLTFLGAPVTGTPRWSPDGKRIAFDSNATGQYEIHVVPAAGGTPEPATAHPALDGGPSWSRDGKWIYFRSDRTGREEVWKTPSDSIRSPTRAVQVTKNGGMSPFESPDGRFVYYVKQESLWRIPAAGGEESKVLSSVTNRCYAVTESGVYFIPAQSRQGGSFTIRFLDFGTRQTIDVAKLDNRPARGLSVSPDGRWILYTQVDHRGDDLMLVENFR